MKEMTAPIEALIVDDERDVCELIANVLQRENIDCTLAYSASEVESLIRDRRFDLVISDISLPEHSGFDILRTVKQICPHAKTIMVTGHRRTDWAREALREGAFDYLEKPFDIDSLNSSIRKALQTMHAERFALDPRNMIDRQCFILLDGDGMIRYVCDNFADITVINPSVAVGSHFDSIFDSSGIALAQLHEQAGVSGRAVATLKRVVGGEYQVEVCVDPISMADEKDLTLLKITDLSPLQGHLQRGLAEMSLTPNRVGHDQLTGLPNHSTFQEELTRIRCVCRRYGRSVSVALISLDKFEHINASEGYAAGDRLLVELAELIRRRVRMADYVARYSGSCFAVIMPETEGAEAMVGAQRLCDEVRRHPFLLGNRHVSVTASIGIVECQSGFIENQNELMGKAEEALQQALDNSEHDVVLWEESLPLLHECVSQPDSAATSDQQPAEKRLRAAYLGIARSLVAAVEAKDPYTKNHSLNVAEYAEFFARLLRLPEDEVSMIRCAATLHDVGKIGIPDAILTKPGRLTDEEFEMIKQHPQMGYTILSQSTFLSAEARLVRLHHERYDGTGYPDGLKGSEIPLAARILQVADSFDAMICARSYKPGFNLDKIIDELKANSGTQFDPDVARAAIEFVQKHHDKIHFPKQ